MSPYAAFNLDRHCLPKVARMERVKVLYPPVTNFFVFLQTFLAWKWAHI